MPGWGTLIKTLIKWGPIAFAAARKYYPYVQNSPAAQRFATSLMEQSNRIPERLSPELRARKKIAAVRSSLAEAAMLGIDPTIYARWRTELDELDRILTLSQAVSRGNRRSLVRQVNERLDRLVAEILPALTGRGQYSPPELPR